MERLYDLIRMLTKNRNLHVSVLDLRGVLNSPITEIPFENVIHATHFCDAAKATARGYRLCLECKRLANEKAVSKKSFCGSCFWGLYEAAEPVIVDNDVVAIVYVGNAVIDEVMTKKRIERTSRLAGANPELIYKSLATCEFLSDESEVSIVARIVRDYIKALVEKIPTEQKDVHWIVARLKKHVDNAFCSNLSLIDLANVYHQNEKYMGRLFKRETGESFCEYRNRLRTDKAAQLLENTSMKIIEIAFECGFNNVPYFNRVFRSAYGVSPGEYRAEIIKR